LTTISDFGTIFGRLKALLQVYEPDLHLAKSDTYDYQLNTDEESGVYFGGVRGEDMKVDFCLQAIEDYPALAIGISNQLRQHMLGKQCFNFEEIDEDMLDELLSLTEASYSKYVEENLVP
jgi:hypothetical protein